MTPRKFNKGNTYVVVVDIHGTIPSESSKASRDSKGATLVLFVEKFKKLYSIVDIFYFFLNKKEKDSLLDAKNKEIIDQGNFIY